MPNWGYFFGGVCFATLAAFGVMITFLTFVPMFSGIMNALSNLINTNGITGPYNPIPFITQGNNTLQGSFAFVMIGLAAMMFFLAFGSDSAPDNTVAFSEPDFDTVD